MLGLEDYASSDEGDNNIQDSSNCTPQRPGVAPARVTIASDATTHRNQGTMRHAILTEFIIENNHGRSYPSTR